jgi:hypothetical protein
MEYGATTNEEIATNDKQILEHLELQPPGILTVCQDL